MSNTIKLQKFLAQTGLTSRRKAEQMIAQGHVLVNKQPAHIGQRIIPGKDHILVKGKPVVTKNQSVYFLVNKPVGYISTTSDELGRKTVLDLLPPQSERLFPVGRLDQDSQGLMLLTNDGQLTQEMTHPSFKTAKTYHVLVAGKPTSKALDHLRRGVKLKDGYTQPAEVAVIGKQDGHTWLEITIHEGRNRQIRRMLERVGYEVVQLIRVKMGPFSLDDLEGKPYKKINLDTFKNTSSTTKSKSK